MSGKLDVTPQPRRRLGLRRSKGSFSTPGQRREVLKQRATPLLTDNETGETDVHQTPRTLPTKPKANSTNCRRLGLSRKRKDLTKKRLEFANADANENQSKKTDCTPSEETNSPLVTSWRQRQILELEADIETWKNGFIAAVDDLQTLVTPQIPKKSLLTQLGIPLEMLSYLDED